MSGRLIVIEGPDGSGTTHHTAWLAESLIAQGFEVLTTSEPSGGAIGGKIREFLASGSLPADALQLLFCADRADHLKNTVLPALNKGKTVICDRYILSTLAYGEALGLDPSWLLDVNKTFIEPNQQIVCLPPLSVCLERLSRRKQADSMEGHELQERVHAAYTRLATEAGISVINTDSEKSKVAARVLELVSL